MDKAWIFLLIFLGTLAAAGAISVWIIQRKLRQVSRSMFGTDSLLEGLEQQEERIAETPKSVSSMTSIYLPQIAKDFPEFSLEEFRKKSENSLNAFLSALETQELSSLAGISESLRNQARLRIDDQDRQGIREQFRNVKIHQTAISRYEKRPGCCAVTFQSAVEYVYGRTRNGEKEVMPDRIQTRYDMEWIYIQDPERYGQAAGGAVGVSCPDCGAPYHRVCYEKLGQCIHRPAHAAGYEWKFPYEESQLRTCPSCGERTLRDEETCRCCGAVLPPEGQEPPSSRGSGEETFDYSQMYRQFGTSADPEKEFFEDAFGKEAKMDGIDRQDWLDYIGPAAPAYLAAYSRMQLQKSKVSMSFSALLFGPFYFFYRKAWKPAFGFLAAELLLAAPTFIEMLQLSGSALAPAMSASALTVFARVCSVLSFVLMLVRGMYGKWLYRKSAADHIRRIQSEFPDAQQRQAVLRAQGGVSFGAVFLCVLLLSVCGSAFTLLLGPDLQAILNAFYG